MGELIEFPTKKYIEYKSDSFYYMQKVKNCLDEGDYIDVIEGVFFPVVYESLEPELKSICNNFIEQWHNGN